MKDRLLAGASWVLTTVIALMVAGGVMALTLKGHDASTSNAVATTALPSTRPVVTTTVPSAPPSTAPATTTTVATNTQNAGSTSTTTTPTPTTTPATTTTTTAPTTTTTTFHEPGDGGTDH